MSKVVSGILFVQEQYMDKVHNIQSKPLSLERSQTPESKVRDVAKLYEKQFLREMVAAMRQTVHSSGLIQENMAEKIFREKLDNEYVEAWGDKGGIGLGDIIYNQLMEKYGQQLGLKNKIQKPQGPIALDNSSNSFRLSKPINTHAEVQARQGSTFVFERLKNVDVGESIKLKNPWEGRLVGQYNLESGEKVLDIEHVNGLKSKILFHGENLVEISKDEPIAAGATLGVVGPETQKVLWKVN